MEFKEKQYDGPYEVVGLDMRIDNEEFKGVIYYPPDKYDKPVPVIIYFHGFPQLFSLPEIVKKYSYLLDMGNAFIAFNFRGYRYSHGRVSICSQTVDGLEVLNFVEQISSNGLLDLNDVNLIAEDFGAYIALLISSRVHFINKLLLINPILDLNRQIESDGFIRMLEYTNRFLPGNVKGIEDIDEFVKLTREELTRNECDLSHHVKDLKINSLKVIIGENNHVAPLHEIEAIMEKSNVSPEIKIIKDMEHEIIVDEENEDLTWEIQNFFKKP